MDLALNLGMTVEQLSRSMTESEFVMWQRYLRKKKAFPLRRIEFFLANIARLVQGGSHGLDRFMLFDEREVKQDTVESGLQAISLIAGSRKVVRLGAKKRAANG